MEEIVVPLDGSEVAAAALRPAYATARRAGSRVRLLSVVEDGGPPATSLQEVLGDHAHTFGEVAPTEVEVRDGDARSILSAIAADRTDSLLCMATHGRGGVKRAVLGSVAGAVVGTDGARALLVGPCCRAAVLPDERAGLLVCSDGTEHGHGIAALAASFAAAADLRACALKVAPPEEEVADDDGTPPDRATEAARRKLAPLVEALSRPGCDAEAQVVYGSRPGRSIATHAGIVAAAYVAMATHGRSGIAGAVLGSVAMDTVHHAPCPVLVLHP